MKSTELLGAKALPFIEWYGDYKESSLEMPWMIDKAHSLYSQPITEDTDFNKLFKGEWEVVDRQNNGFVLMLSNGDFWEVMKEISLDSFITNSPVKLEWNLFEV